MEDGIVSKTMQRSNLVMMLIAVLGVLSMMGVAAIQNRYLYNFVKGPFAISGQQLLAMQDPTKGLQYYVTVQGDELYDTGYQFVRTNKDGSETVEQYYMALAVGDRLLLVKSASDQLATKISGALLPLNADEQANVITGLESEVPEIKGAFLPFVLDANNFRKDGYLGLALMGGLLVLCIYLALLALRRSTNPLSHPIMKSLAVYGSPEVIASELDHEVALGVLRIGPVSVTNRWMIVSGWLTMMVMRLQDIQWAYKKVTQHRTNGIPTGKTYAAIVYDKNGKVATVSMKETKVNEILQALHDRLPWIIIGYSEDLARLWKKDRTSIVQEIERRKSTGTTIPS